MNHVMTVAELKWLLDKLPATARFDPKAVRLLAVYSEGSFTGRLLDFVDFGTWCRETPRESAEPNEHPYGNNINDLKVGYY